MTSKNDTTNTPPAQAARAPRPTLAPLPPSTAFLASLRAPVKPWLTQADYSDDDLKSNVRSSLARRDVRSASIYAAELARRNTLRQMVAEYGYASVAAMTAVAS
jgi:hypothetical protein